MGKALRHLLHKHINDLGFSVVPAGGNVCTESALRSAVFSSVVVF